jgi:hypothetical protein
MARPKSNNNDQVTQKSVLTPEQQSIAERVASQDTDWFAIGEESMTDFSLMVNPMDLMPNYPEAAKLQNEKKFAFRWCERTPQRVDQLTRSVSPPLKWAIVNRNNLPEMDRHIDPMLGGVCCLDQILLFKPWAHAAMVRKAKDEMADARFNAPRQRIQTDGKIEVKEGREHRIGSNDVVTYQDERSDGLGDLVVEE